MRLFSIKQFPLIQSLLIILLFSAVTLVIYSNTFNSPFVLDDLRKIEDNPAIRVDQFAPVEIMKAGFQSSRMRPVAFMTLALNHSLHKYDVYGYHVVNVAIHILTGFFLYLVIAATLKTASIQHRYSQPDLIAFFAALIWLVHPIQTQSVIYIVQRTNSLATLFFILSFLFYIYGRQTSRTGYKWIWLIASAFAWALSLGCKQITAILPFIIFIYEWFFFQDLNRDWIKKRLKYLPGIIIFFILLVLVYTNFSPLEKIKSFHDYAADEFTVTERLLTQFRVVIWYISLIIFPIPSRLNLDYDFALSHSLLDPITTTLALIAISGLMALSFFLASKNRLLAFCIIWFFGTHLIESSILPLAIIFEHRNYLPSMMVCLVPVVLVYHYLKIDWLKIGLLCALVVVLSAWAHQRNRVWEDNVTLWTDVVQKSPNKARPHFNLGVALSEQNNDAEAIPHYQRTLEINPGMAHPHINLGRILEKQNRIEEAAAHYLTALQNEPDLPEAHSNMGAILMKQGRTEEAIQFYQKALTIRPQFAQAHFGLANAHVQKGDFKQGIRHYYLALQFKPDYAEAHSNLGSIFLNAGENEKAINHYFAALQIDPVQVQAYNNLGIALMQEGRIEAAISQFQKALQLKPDFVMAQNNLRRALAIKKEIESEISHLQDIITNDPGNVELHFQLGNLYFRKGDRNRAMQQYKKALQLDPKFLPALNNLALVTAANKEYYKALTVFLDLLNYIPDDADTHYNIACMYSRLNRVNESIDWLKKAIDKGYSNWESIKTDGDLDNIRNSLAYKSLIQGH